MAIRDVRNIGSNPQGLRRLWPQIGIAAAFGLLLGLASLRLSPLIIIGFLLVIFYNILLFYRAEIGIISMLIVTSTIIFENTLPIVRLGFGSFHLTDLALMALIGQVVIKRLLQPGFRIVRTPLDYFLIGFFVIAFASTAFAIFQNTVSSDMVFRELRVFSYYLVFFAVTNLIRTKKQWLFFVRGIFFLAAIVAIAMMAQAVSARTVSFLPGYAATLVTQGASYSGVIRVMPPGQSLILLGFITSVVLLITYKEPQLSGPLKVALSALLGFGLVLTFTRAYLISSIVSLALLVYILRSQDRQRLIKIVIASLIVLGAVFYVSSLQPESRFSKITLAFIARVSTLGEGDILNSQQSTLRWRSVEYEYSLPQIVNRPVLGAGIGSRYRPWDTRLDWRAEDDSGFDGRAYTHNAHFWIILKTGFLGYFCFVGLSLVFVGRGLHRWLELKEPIFRSVVLGFTLAYIAVLIGSITSPMLAESFWVPVLGSIFGLNEVAYRLDSAATTPDNVPMRQKQSAPVA